MDDNKDIDLLVPLHNINSNSNTNSNYNYGLRTQSGKLQRIMRVRPAYDLRKEEKGIGSADIIFFVKGKLGAIQFRITTGWHLPYIQKSLYGDKDYTKLPSTFGIAYHSPKPIGDTTIMHFYCDLVDGKCYFGMLDKSFDNGEKLFNILIKDGDEAMWKYLENYYKETFGALE